MEIKSELIAEPVGQRDGTLSLEFPGIRVVTDRHTEFLGDVSSAEMLLHTARIGDCLEVEAQLRDAGVAVAARVRVLSHGPRRSVVA